MDTSCHSIQLRVITPALDQGHQCRNVVHKPKPLTGAGLTGNEDEANINCEKLQLGDFGRVLGPEVEELRRIGDLIERPRWRRRARLGSRWLRLLLDSHCRSPRHPDRGWWLHRGLTGRYRQYHRGRSHLLGRRLRRLLLREASPLQRRLIRPGRQAWRHRRLRLRL